MKKKYIFIGAGIILLLLIIGGTGNKDNTNNTPSQNQPNTEKERTIENDPLEYFETLPNDANVDWDEIRANDVAQTSDEWGTPQLHPASTTGYEDSAYLSLDGNEIYFMYSHVDQGRMLWGDGKIVRTGPYRDFDKQCTHPELLQPHTCGRYPRADLFYATKINGEWQEAVPHPLTLTGPVGGMTLVGENKAYFMHGFQDNYGTTEDIGYAEKVNGVWGEKIKIEEVSMLEYTDADPFVTQDDSEMFFWSDRPAKFEDNNIYRSVKINGVWQEPELLAEPINTNHNDMQVILHEGYLYFSSGRDPRFPIAVYKSKRLGDNEWDEPELVMSSKSGVGEMTFTADGNTMSFVQVFSDGNHWNFDIMYVQRK